MMSSLAKPTLILMLLAMAGLGCKAVTGLAGVGEEGEEVEATLAARPGTSEGPPSGGEYPTAPPTPTPSADDVRLVVDLEKPDVVDTFDDKATWFDFDTAGRAAYRFEDGRLTGIDYEPEERYSWWSYSERESGNLYAEITSTIGECAGKDSVGFVIRVDPQSAAGGYALEVSCDGHWRFRRHRQGKQAVDLTEWTPFEQIRPGPQAVNRLAIWAYENRFVLFVNGYQVEEIFDRGNSYTYGRLAVYVRASETSNLTASFDDFKLWHIPFIP